ncbi:MAG TPA: hypothetical protein VH163_05125, partial [Gemmatimonadales bacterium]|nr:hypothetical protein [Gemmatimonadales bacterium]
MTTARSLAAIVVVVTACRGDSPGRPEATRTYPPTPARAGFERDLDALSVALDSLDVALPGGARARAAFRAARVAYKHVESLLEVLSPVLAHELNGPLPEANEDRPAPPLGGPEEFQVVEAALFSGGEAPTPDSLRATLR